jgi:hypothetical protein
MDTPLNDINREKNWKDSKSRRHSWNFFYSFSLKHSHQGFDAKSYDGASHCRGRKVTIALLSFLVLGKIKFNLEKTLGYKPLFWSIVERILWTSGL